MDGKRIAIVLVIIMSICSILLLILYHGRYRSRNSGVLEQEERLELFIENIGSVNL